MTRPEHDDAVRLDALLDGRARPKDAQEAELVAFCADLTRQGRAVKPSPALRARVRTAVAAADGTDGTHRAPGRGGARRWPGRRAWALVPVGLGALAFVLWAIAGWGVDPSGDPPPAAERSAVDATPATPSPRGVTPLPATGPRLVEPGVGIGPVRLGRPPPPSHPGLEVAVGPDGRVVAVATTGDGFETAGGVRVGTPWHEVPGRLPGARCTAGLQVCEAPGVCLLFSSGRVSGFAVPGPDA